MLMFQQREAVWTVFINSENSENSVNSVNSVNGVNSLWHSANFISDGIFFFQNKYISYKSSW